MKSILVRAPNWIGDQVLAFPFFHYLRKAYPKARIGVVCQAWVKDLQFRNCVDEVFVLPKVYRDTFSEKLKAIEEGARAVRERGPWDLGISLPNSLSAAWVLFRAGAKLRRGYRVEGRGLLLNDGLAWDGDPERHRAQAYVDLLPLEARPERSVKEFWDTPAENELDDPIPGELSVFDPQAAWSKFEPLQPPSGPYWVLAPGATADSRRWPVEYVRVLARRIADETGWTGVIVGGPSEAPIAEQLCSDPLLKLKDMTARGPVPALWKIFREARFTVTNESGLAHVASLCGSFVQIVCGAADPRRTRPLGPGVVRVAINPVECWPCERNTCSLMGEEKNRCLHGIRPDTVWEEIKRGVRISE